MNKILKRTMVSVLAACSVLSAAACGGRLGGGLGGGKKYNPADPKSLKVVVSNLGFGTDWAKAIAKAFERTHPGVTVTVEDTVLSSALLSQMEAGNNIGDVCMFNDDALWSKWRDGLLTEIDDVVNATPDGESKSVYEKMNKTLIDSYQVANGHFYSVPWVNENLGLVYNETSLDKLLGAGNWELPKTTNELWKMCDDVKTAGGYGFVWNAAYLDTSLWQAQYNGLEKNEKYAMGYYLDEADGQWKMSTGEATGVVNGNSVKVIESSYQNVGAARAVKQMEKIVQKYSHRYAANMTHIYAQSCWAGIPYAGDSKPCVFMPNGDWTYNETLDYIIDTGCEIGFMRYPVISDIVETLELYEDGSTPYAQLSQEKQNTYDAQLRSVIDFIDEGETGTRPEGVSDDDLDRIREARQMMGGKCQTEAFIPKRSTKTDLAKEFLVFMASDMAIDIFSQNTYGFSPYISNEKMEMIDFGVKFFDDVQAVLKAAPLKVISKYTNIRQAGYYGAYEISYASSLKTYSAEVCMERGMVLLQEKWEHILKNADRKAGQLWVEGSFEN